MIENLPVINWFEEPIKKSVASVFDGLNDFVESLDALKRYRNVHFEIVRSQVQTVKILGMQNPMDLARLYYPTHVSTDIRRRIYKPDWANIDGAKHQPDTKIQKTTELGFKFIESNQRTVLLGGPGAGKTTFLKYLALAYVDEPVYQKAGLTRSQVPAYIQLPSLLREDIDFLQVIANSLSTRTDFRAHLFIKRLLETGNLTLLLDSLDEVPSEMREAVVGAIQNFSNLYPKTKIIVTCRTADYHQVFDNFSEAEIARLDSVAVKSIVREWFQQSPDRGEKLVALLESDQTVAALTETPLLLSLLCIQYRNDLALPKRKTELYRRCVDALLRDWDASRNFRRDTKYSQLSDDRKEMIFEYVAGANACNDIVYEFGEPALLSTVSDIIERNGISGNDAKGILAEIESHHGIIEKCSAETYQFSHGTMHEYFLARHLVQTRQEMNALKIHFEDDGWHTVIGFMCAIINDPSQMLQFLMQQSSTKNFKNYPTFGKRLAHLLLLYRCMTMGVAIPPALRNSICAHLIESQIDMIIQLHADKIIPYAARRPQGVRQTLVTYSGARPRSTIDKLLLPYRSLMNEVYLSPLPDYVEAVLRLIPELEKREDIADFAKMGVMTCLLCPIADAKPQEFYDLMFKCSAQLLQLKAETVRGVVVESMNVHMKLHSERISTTNSYASLK